MDKQLKLDEKKIRKGSTFGLPWIGSKRKIAKKIVEIIKQNFGTDKVVYDLFGGGGAITIECLINGLKVVYNDKDPLLAEMINLVLSKDREWLKSLMISRDEFYRLKEKEDKTTEEELKILINSFGYNRRDYIYGKEIADFKHQVGLNIVDKYDVFEGYRKTELYKRLQAGESFEKYKLKCLQQIDNTLQLERLQQLQRLQQLERLDNMYFFKQNLSLGEYYESEVFDLSHVLFTLNEDYREFSFVKDSILYLDPPYENLRSKQYNCKLENYQEFYDWCHKMSENNIVLISGYEMPDDFDCVFEFRKTRPTMQSGQHKTKYEKLFMPNNTKIKF